MLKKAVYCNVFNKKTNVLMTDASLFYWEAPGNLALYHSH